jgi:4-amino-4-deoxy-L-arabinose transferase-like glycosyltransferase
MLSALLLPANLLATQRFHQDEALYATWALPIISGTDLWLAHTPIDKPPLFIYLLAGSLRLLGITETAARVPSLLAAAATVTLTFWLGRRLYGSGVGLLAAWLVALSPFTILFAPTAFTDPLLAALIMAAGLAAAHGRAGWAGLGLGLALATKQQAIFFIPLVTGLLGLSVRGRVFSNPGTKVSFRYYASRFLVALLLTLVPLIIWNFTRTEAPNFLGRSLGNYGGLTTDLASFNERWQGFVELLYYGTASSLLNTIFVVGLPILLTYGWWASRLQALGEQGHETGTNSLPSNLPTTADWLFSLFSLAFLLGHALFSFQIWDRYLLGLIPLLALLLARILLLPWSVLKPIWLKAPADRLRLTHLLYGLGLALLLMLTLTRPIRDAVNGRYPLGSHSQALAGIEQIVAYLQGQVGANHTLYQRWLGLHWRFYLWGYPYDLQYWSSPQELAGQAKPGHLIAFPSWQSNTTARLALTQAGLRLQELARAYHPAGYPSFILYRIEAMP